MMKDELKPDQASIDVGTQFVRDVARDKALDLMSLRSLQQVIDCADDHNQSMIDAMREVNPGMQLEVERLMRDGTEPEAWWGIVNKCFRGAEYYIESLKTSDPAGSE